MQPRKVHNRTYMAASNWTLSAWAIGKTQSAIKSGLLVRPDVCSMCASQGNRQNPILAHHDDYAKPIEVRWVCRECHKRLHYPLASGVSEELIRGNHDNQ